MSLDHLAIYTSDTEKIDVNRHALEIMQYFAFDATTLVIQLSLSSLLFGALTILSFSSIFLLFRRRASANTPIGIPLLSTIVLYASTAVYLASFVWNWRSMSRTIREASEGIFSETYDRDASLPARETEVLKQSWMATIALGINIIVGDAVVWWRACVIWRHRAIYYSGPILLLVTLVLGLVAALLPDAGPSPFLDPGLLSGNRVMSDTAIVLSLVTNLVATSLIALKAFFHRRRFKRYLNIFETKTQVLKVFALFIESGSLYCIMLLVVFIYQFDSDTTSVVFEAGNYFILGCFVPLVAIYPTSIVFFTALNWSPLDSGFSPLKEPGQPGPHTIGGHQWIYPPYFATLLNNMKWTLLDPE